MNQYAKFSRIVKAMSFLIKDQKPPKADINLAALNTLIQDGADAELLVLHAEAKDVLRTALTAAVANTAPGAVAEVRDDIEVMIFIVMQDPALLAKLNAASRKAGIKNAIDYLNAALAAK